MKKVICLSVFVTCFLYSHAQVLLDVKSGVNFANNKGNYVKGLKTKLSFFGGVGASYKVWKMFHVRAEVYYSDEGSKYKGGKTSIKYLNIPLMLEYDHPCGFFVHTGPQLGFLLDARDYPDDLPSESGKYFFKSTIRSWTVGAGYFFSKYHAGINLRYTQDIANITVVQELFLRNYVAQAGLFYRFTVGKRSRSFDRFNRRHYNPF